MLINRWFCEGAQLTHFAVEVPSTHENCTLFRSRVFRQSTQRSEGTPCS